MNAFQIALLLYAIIIAAGGVMGYVSAQSTVSLANGLIAAVILLIGLAISFRNPAAGFGLSAVVALALGVFFAYRFFTTGKWMPGGVTMILSAVAFVLMLLATLRTR
ncbi:MAG: TMEM14 family protein [Fimbriimonadales bacterium]